MRRERHPRLFGVIDRLLLRAPAYVTDPQRVVSIAVGRRVDGNERLQWILIPVAAAGF